MSLLIIASDVDPDSCVGIMQKNQVGTCSAYFLFIVWPTSCGGRHYVAKFKGRLEL